MKQSENASEQSWYVVETSDGGGNKAHLALAVAGLKCWRPVDVKQSASRKPGKVRRYSRRPRFGRYFFIRCAMSDELLAAIRQMTGVADVLCSRVTFRPIPIADEHIAWLKDAKNFAPPSDLPPLKSRVRIKEGPFENFEAIVRAVDKSGTVRVEVEIFGRPVPLILQAGHVVVIGPQSAPPGNVTRETPASKHRAA